MTPFLAFAALTTYSYWVEPCHPSAKCKPEDAQLAEWALQAWERASEGALTFRRVDDRDQARFRFYWAAGRRGLYGEVKPITVNGARGAEIYVRPALDQFGPHIATIGDRDPLFRETIVYLTCVHESGHALGLGHSIVFDDAMYTFRAGGDVVEYFLRYSRKLTKREDILKYSGLSAGDVKRLRVTLTRSGGSPAAHSGGPASN